MAKRSVFEELLETDLRWPKKDDAPFQQSEEGDQNAQVNYEGIDRLVFMISGYKQAADLMVHQARQSRHDRDRLVFPTIFNYRQYIELSLKYMLAIFGPFVGVKANWRTHDLRFLWSEFVVLLDRYGTVDPDEADQVIGHVVAEFSKVDPNSYSYRYPVDLKGEPIPIEHQELDLSALGDVMSGVEAYFTGCDGYLDAAKSAVEY